uniref:Uncharacterized protein n=1 Tax=Anopheles albimanus TaxID=7167 RepID=A0A182FQG7_ANOAL
MTNVLHLSPVSNVRWPCCQYMRRGLSGQLLRRRLRHQLGSAGAARSRGISGICNLYPSLPFQRFPYPPFYNDPLLFGLESLFLVIIMIAFFYSLQLKESMKVMGLNINGMMLPELVTVIKASESQMDAEYRPSSTIASSWVHGMRAALQLQKLEEEKAIRLKRLEIEEDFIREKFRLMETQVTEDDDSVGSQGSATGRVVS